ncbi:hypothetical protein ACK3TF_005668 [Chlorella vulgaris]
MAQHLYHMVEAAQWKSCKAQGTPYYPPTYEADGFTHLTADPALLLTVANHFYTSSVGDWIVLVLDASELTAEVKYEPAAPVGNISSTGVLGGAERQEATEAPPEPLFPHLYGSIDFAAVRQELPMQRGPTGSFLSIQGLPAALADSASNP